MRAVLGDKSVQLLDGKGEAVVEVWFRKAVPAKATDAQIQNGLTYAEIPESTIMAAMRVVKPFTDYKKQKIKPGVYTLRLARQPMDGDHMGTAPYSDFCLAVPAADDKKTDLVEAKTLQEMSAKSTGGHPGVFLLFPGGKDAAGEPKLVNKGTGHWVLFSKQDVAVGAKKSAHRHRPDPDWLLGVAVKRMATAAGRTAIITGASRGIGRAIALGLARAGWNIVVAAKSTTSTEKLPGSIYTVADEITALGEPEVSDRTGDPAVSDWRNRRSASWSPAGAGGRARR